MSEINIKSVNAIKMADKVENILEKMTDELLWYQEESLFSNKQVKKIVKERRNHEYQL